MRLRNSKGKQKHLKPNLRSSGIWKNKGWVRFNSWLKWRVRRHWIVLWLESLSESQGVMTLQGTAMDNDTVALFMTELEKAPQIRSVDLDKTTLKFFPEQKLRAAGFCVGRAVRLMRQRQPKRKKPRRKKDGDLRCPCQSHSTGNP